MQGKWKWIIVAAVAVVLAIPVGTFVYIHFIEGPAPAKLTLQSGATTTSSAPASSAASSSAASSSTTAAAAAASTDISGSYAPTSASQVGYRVKENLFGQSSTAVGRTNQIEGTMNIAGKTVSAVDLTVDMASVSSDRSQRDGQFRGRIMDVSTYPTATFKLTSPIALPSVPTDGTEVDVNATGELTLHGTTKTVTVAIKALRTGATINVNGSIPIHFPD